MSKSTKTIAPSRKGRNNTTSKPTRQPAARSPETPSALAVRELREWFHRHGQAGRSEIHSEEVRANIDDGLAAVLAREAVGHALGAIDLGRHLGTDTGAHAYFEPSNVVTREAQHFRRPASLRFSFGEAYDLPRVLPELGTAPGRWRVLSDALADFHVGCMRPEHRGRTAVLDDAADRIVGLGRWPTPRDVAAAFEAARAKGGAS